MNGQAPLAGIRVLDLASLYAGPFAAMLLGDLGADVIKVEHPRGDPMRRLGMRKDDIPLWWKMIGRNKRCLALDLSRAEGRDVLLDLAATADVVVENFRPGRLENWGLGYDRLSARNPGLVLLRLTGFGQTGPYSHRTAFGTQAECMSGWVYASGEPGCPPMLPPFGLSDPLSGLTGAFACVTALLQRGTTGRGQVIDATLMEPMLFLTGPAITYYDQLGVVAEPVGNRSRQSAPRNVYRSRDKRWIAVSTSAQSVAERVLRLVGRADLTEQPWFATASQRVQHADELDQAVGSWIAAHDAADVIEQFAAASAAACPIYDTVEVLADPQYAALGTVATVDDPDLGSVRMPNMLFRLSESGGAIRHTGRNLGADTDEVLGRDLGYDQERIAVLRSSEVIT